MLQPFCCSCLYYTTAPAIDTTHTFRFLTLEGVEEEEGKEVAGEEEVGVTNASNVTDLVTSLGTVLKEEKEVTRCCIQLLILLLLLSLSPGGWGACWRSGQGGTVPGRRGC